MMTEQDITKKYLGVPYKYKGRDLNGLDCWGLFISIYKDLDIQVDDFGIDYTEDWAISGKNYIEENAYLQWEEIDIPKVFDGVLLKSEESLGNHVGIVLSKGKFIHCCKAGTVISSLKAFKNKILGFYRFK